MGLHNFSKGFRSNITTTIVCLQKSFNQKPFDGFNNFRCKMTNKMFFEETKSGVFKRNKNFHIKSSF